MTHPYPYEPIDRYITLNADDPDLFPIRIDLLDLLRRTYRQYGLPEPDDFPPIEEAAGYGLPPDDQVFEREVIPDALIRLERQVRNDLKKQKRITAIQIELTAINNFWEQIETHPDKYADEIEWLKRMWTYRLLGKFILIKGKLTYLTGGYWWYLNWIWLDDTRPEYRHWDMFQRIGIKFCKLDTTTFKDIDPKTRKPIPNEQGEYEMIDLGQRVCGGINDAKSRRVGDTSGMQSDGMEESTRMVEGHFGTQGRDEKHAKKVFQQQFVRPFEKIPIFFKPVWDSTIGVKPKEHMLFDGDTSDFGLHTRITHATSANAENFNGDKLYYYHRDEAGNCLGIDTPVLMYDGTIKKVQDVVVGDLLMGPDSRPRTVLSLNRGMDQMYMILPKKGNSWRCNSRHILSLKMSASRSVNYVKGDVKNISIQQYNAQGVAMKKSMVLYKTGVEFSEKQHFLDPYFIGLWLGDGTKSTVDITTPDSEIIDYLYEFAEKHNLKVSKYTQFIKELGRDSKASTYNLAWDGKSPVALYKDGELFESFNSCKEAGEYLGVAGTNVSACSLGKFQTIHGFTIKKLSEDKNAILTELQRLKLINNKHIPDEYLYDSTENRLRLLAGIIDTDGSLDSGYRSYSYEISQVKQDLSEQIVFLIRSLGFSASMVRKRFSSDIMGRRRTNGFINRISIYGKDLYRIPCKVERKRIKEQIYSKNSKARNPLHAGFKVVPDGIGHYFGFTIDGDQLFMLGDFTVTHNSPNEDVNKGHKIVKFCLSLGDRLIGFCAYTTTVEEVDSGSAGENYMNLCMDSMYDQRDDNGRTRSWMYNIFIPAEYRIEGYIDKWGFPITGDPTPEQEAFSGKKQGSIKWIENTVKDLTRKKDWTSLAIFQRQYPRKFRDCFSPPGKNQFFPTELIRNRIQYLNFVDRSKLPERGDFEWTNGFGSDVQWIPNDQGRWLMSKTFRQDEINRRRQQGGIWYPENRLSIVHAADTFGSDQTQGRASLGGLAARWLYDPTIDPPTKDVSLWQSDRLIITYKNRPETVDDFCEDCLKQAIYCGGLIYPERNKDHVEPYFRRMGYDGYLLYDFNHDGTQKSKSAGFYSQEGVKLKIFNFTQKDLVKNVDRTTHVDWLEECSLIMDPSQMTRFDLFTAVGGTLLAAQNPYYNIMSRASSLRFNTAKWVEEVEY